MTKGAAASGASASPAAEPGFSTAARRIRNTKRRLRAVLARPALSRALTTAVRPFAPRLSVRTLLRLPVARIVEVRSVLCPEPVFLDAAGVDPIASLLYWRGSDGWEPETLPAFLRLVTPGAVVVDVGANTGLFSVLAARRQPDAEVHAIEPVPRVFELLRHNVLLNGLSNVTCHQLAFSDSSDTAVMYVPREDLPIMASMLPDWRSDVDQIEVSARTLDDFAAHLGKPIDVLKIDTEGTEALVLAGGMQTLNKDQPFVVCEVLLAGQTADHLTDLMNSAGYSIYLLDEEGPRQTDCVLGNEAEGCRNYLFIPASRVSRAMELLGILSRPTAAGGGL